MFLRFFSVCSLFFLLALTVPARADDYIQATWPDLAHTLVRFNALNLTDQNILDEYAMITDCELYKAFYADDFKWNEVRQAMLKSMQLNVATYPMYYRYDVNLQLDRYDFTNNIFRFRPKATLKNVNTFVIYTVEGNACGTGLIKIIPRSYRVVLPAPIDVEGLPLASQDAEAILKHMDQDKNTDRIVYTRINLRVVYIDPLRKAIGQSYDKTVHYGQSNMTTSSVVRLDARLDSIDFYEDADRKTLIYHYQP